MTRLVQRVDSSIYPNQIIDRDIEVTDGFERIVSIIAELKEANIKHDNVRGGGIH